MGEGSPHRQGVSANVGDTRTDHVGLAHGPCP